MANCRAMHGNTMICLDRARRPPPLSNHLDLRHPSRHTGLPGLLPARFPAHAQRADTLYLVGDILDGWQLRKGWYWPQAHNDVVQKLLRNARKGTRVIYIPGNHDELARQFIGLAIGDIAVVEEAIHTHARPASACGSRTAICSTASCSTRAGSPRSATRSTRSPAKLNRWFNALRQRLGLAVLVDVAVPEASGQERGAISSRISST